MNMRIAPILCCAVLLTASAHAADTTLPQGTIMLLDVCPGDTDPGAADPKAAASAHESFVTALLTPLLGGVVNNGLKAIGAKLQEAAAEAQVDAIATGDYFYITDPKDKTRLALKFNCVVVATKATKATKQNLSEMLARYRPATLTWDKFARRTVGTWATASDARPLVTALKNAGYTETSKPAMVVVFDIEQSPARTDMRLIPRFVTMDHSIREKTVDSKLRDMTFEIKFTGSGGTTVIGTELFKFDSLGINAPRRRLALDISNPTADGKDTDALLMPGQWFPLPAVSDAVKARIGAIGDAKSQIDVEKLAAEMAQTAAKALGDVTLAAPDCPAEAVMLKPWAKKNAELLVELAKPTASQNSTRIAQLTQVTTFYGACQRLRNAEKKRDAMALIEAEPFSAVDIAINVKEFRERPAAKFFGDVLADDETRKGMTTAIMGAIDPGTRAAEAEKEAAEKLTQRKAFEDALMEAEKAKLVYAAAEDKDKATTYLDMEYKKRAANRLADELKLPRPYPESGGWFTG